MEALVIGSGLSGAVAARRLAEKGYKTTILEKRDHIGGNMHDYFDDHGILVHQYGPHTFHTNKKKLIEYISRFAEWQPFKLTCGAIIKDRFTPAPFNFQTIDDFHDPEEAACLKSQLKKEFPDQKKASILDVLSSKNSIIRKYGEFLFENDYRPYTSKQWGIPPEKIDKSVLKRVPVRLDYVNGYFDDEYQILPKTTYQEFFRSLLDHANISVKLNTDALASLKAAPEEQSIYYKGERTTIPVIYTGPIDELFQCRFGELPYRSLRFEWRHEEKASIQPMPVVAYPQKEYTRITEYKKLPVQDAEGTTYAMEYSLPYKRNVNEPYYPVLTEESARLLKKYKDLSSQIPNLFCCGRLGDFKYYNMDEALENALSLEIT